MLSLLSLPLLALSARALVVSKRQDTNNFGIDYPPHRGTADATEDISPCGGYTLGGRFDFPLSGGRLSILQEEIATDVVISYARNEEPSSNTHFTQFLPKLDVLYPGRACLPLDLGSEGLAVGDTASIQLKYKGPDGDFYQCADLRLISDSDYQPEEYVCQNSTSFVTTLPSSISKVESFSPVGAGFIGAVVALVLGGIAFFGLTRLGLATIGRSKRYSIQSAPTAREQNPFDDRTDAVSLASTINHPR